MAKYTYHPVCAMPGKGPGVIMEGLSKACFDEIRAFVLNNWSDCEEYKMKRGVDPFLQGQDESIGWLFIEFWGSSMRAKNLYAEAIHKIFEAHEVGVMDKSRSTALSDSMGIEDLLDAAAESAKEAGKFFNHTSSLRTKLMNGELVQVPIKRDQPSTDDEA